MAQHILIADTNVTSALMGYVKYGLSPGSFTTSLLMGDLNDAYRHAHPILKKSLMGRGSIRMGDDGVQNLFWFTNSHLPPMIRLSIQNIKTWSDHHGMHMASNERVAQYQLEMEKLAVLVKLRDGITIDPDWWRNYDKWFDITTHEPPK